MKDAHRVHAQKAGRSQVAARSWRGTAQDGRPGQRSQARRAHRARALETDARSAQPDRAGRGGGARVNIVNADNRTHHVRNASSKGVNVNKNADLDAGDRATSEKQDNQ